jgi:hypothetical protein
MIKERGKRDYITQDENIGKILITEKKKNN